MDDYQIIPNQKLDKAMAVLYNVWFRKWKGIPPEKMTDKQWDICIAELNRVVEQGGYTAVYNLGMVLFSELEERYFRRTGGYGKRDGSL